MKKIKRPEGVGWCWSEEIGKWFRLRRLTPRECFRLQDVSEKDIDTIQASGISNSQQYKMAGNSIVVACLEGIFEQMFYPVREEGTLF